MPSRRHTRALPRAARTVLGAIRIALRCGRGATSVRRRRRRGARRVTVSVVAEASRNTVGHNANAMRCACGRAGWLVAVRAEPAAGARADSTRAARRMHVRFATSLEAQRATRGSTARGIRISRHAHARAIEAHAILTAVDGSAAQRRVAVDASQPVGTAALRRSSN